MHTGAPELHAMTPDAQRVPVGRQTAPAVHGTQAPEPLHTPPEQLVPAAALPLALHTGAPVPHAMVPARHGLPEGAQLEPAAHATQLPEPLHTMPAPQLAPAGTFEEAMHTGAPEVHTVVPCWHGLPGGVHAAPALHATQAPAPLHT